jgi:hypothetical protein
MIFADVVVQTNHGWFGNQSAPLPPEERFQLTSDLYIEKLDSVASNMVLDFGIPAGYEVMKPVRQYAYFYAFVRQVPVPASVHDWDTDQRLQTAVALSRLVRPTSISFRHAARIHYNDDGTLKSAYPAWLTGVDPDSWLAPEKNYRDWLIEAEMKQLRALLNSSSLSVLPVRLSRALWYHEYASRTYYGEIRWITVCVALESMLHTSRGYSTRQFVERLPRMASGLGVSLNTQEAETAYEMRSRLSHGGATGKLAPSEEQLYLKLELVLRAALKEAVLNSTFAAIFADENMIRSKWPIVVRGTNV